MRRSRGQHGPRRLVTGARARRMLAPATRPLSRIRSRSAGLDLARGHVEQLARAPSQPRPPRATRSRSAPSSPRPRRPPPSCSIRVLDRLRLGRPAPRPARRSARARARRISSIVTGSSAALVSACGVPQHPDGRLAEHVVEREPGQVERVRAQSSEPSASSEASRSLALGVERAGDQAARPRSAEPTRELVGERRVERVGAVRERVHRAGAQLRPRARWSSARGRPARGDGRTPATPSWPAGSRWIAVISAPESVVGIAATSAAANRGDRLGGVDHPPAAERDQVDRSRRSSRTAAATSGTWPGRDQVRDAPPPRRSAGRARERPLGREQLELGPALLGERRRRRRRAAPRAAAPSDCGPRRARSRASVRHKPGAGLEPAAS